MIRKNPAHDTDTPAGCVGLRPTAEHWSERSGAYKPGSADRIDAILMQDENSGSQGRKFNEWMANRANSRQEARDAAEHLGATTPSTSAENVPDTRLDRLLKLMDEYKNSNMSEACFTTDAIDILEEKA